MGNVRILFLFDFILLVEKNDIKSTIVKSNIYFFPAIFLHKNLGPVCAAEGCGEVLAPDELRIEVPIKIQVEVKASQNAPKSFEWKLSAISFCPNSVCMTKPKKKHVSNREIPKLGPGSAVIVHPAAQLTASEKKLISENNVKLVLLNHRTSESLL